MKCISLRVPGSSANLGPGFDTLGVALSIYNKMTFTERASGISFSGCAPRYRNESNLVYRAYRDVFAAVGRPAPSVHIDFTATEVPVSRGLGSSAALLVGGAVAANRMLGDPLTKGELLSITNRLEGHPDNLAPAIFGGLRASLTEDGVPYTVSCPLSDKIGFHVFIPSFGSSTRAARRALPKEVSYAAAVYNISHTATLLRAMAEGDATLLSLSLRDKLHQPYRKKLIAEYDAVEAIARRAGAAGFCISGSGSTLLAVTVDTALDTARLDRELSRLSHKWRHLALSVDLAGAVVTEEREI